MNKEYSAWLFDWDGTLVDSCEIVLSAHNHVRAAYQLEPLEANDLFGAVNRSARESYPEIFADKAEEALRMLYGYIDENHLIGLKAMAGAEAFLSALAERDIPMAVVSNKAHQVLVREIAHFGWEGFFGAVVGAGEAASDKPSAAPLELAGSRLSPEINLKDIIYVGDTETDLLCARGVACDAALLTEGKDKSALIDSYKPAWVAHDLAQLADNLDLPRAPKNQMKAC